MGQCCTKYTTSLVSWRGEDHRDALTAIYICPVELCMKHFYSHVFFFHDLKQPLIFKLPRNEPPYLPTVRSVRF